MMKTNISAIVFAAACITMLNVSVRAQSLEHRRFEFDYRTKIVQIPESARVVDLWLPIPPDTDEQTVRVISPTEESLSGGAQIHTEPVFGNRIFHRRFSAPFEGDIEVALSFEVMRREVLVGKAKRLVRTRHVSPAATMKRYLGPTAMVPLDGKLSDIARELKLTPDDPLRTGRRVYDYVIELMSYDKSKPGWGRGDVLWACDSRTGNCSDFHSIFSGLARTQQIPAMFEIGFPLPPDRTEGEIGGYHCWAWFHVADLGWVPVDASEADKHPELKEYYFGALTADRIAFSRGRDLQLVPPQQGPPLNFFIYPYVEVDGAPHEGIEKSFTFRDVTGEDE